MAIFANPAMRGYVLLGGWDAVLGALDPQAVAQQIISAHPKLNANARNAVISSAQAGRVVNAGGAAIYIPGTRECSASGVSSNVKIAQISGQLALTGINMAAAAGVGFGIGAALGPATLGISTLIGLFPLLFGHHAAAVRKEQNVLCTAVPAANNYLQIIDDAVRSGKATPQQGIAALQSLQSDFHSAVAPIMKECNAACVMDSAMQAAVTETSSKYQDLADQQAAAAARAAAAAPPSAPVPAGGAGPTTAPPVASGSTMQLPVASTPAQVQAATGNQVAAPGASPSWLPIAALVVAGIFLAKVL